MYCNNQALSFIKWFNPSADVWETDTITIHCRYSEQWSPALLGSVKNSMVPETRFSSLLSKKISKCFIGVKTISLSIAKLTTLHLVMEGRHILYSICIVMLLLLFAFSVKCLGYG